ncbi:hypothetical protein [Mesorhizobium sp. M0159]|uniref:hypothetical protein n=1 Tax=Mesorhizobium sp. M0159 TaxID=2956900 RepID=UPI00333AFAF2
MAQLPRHGLARHTTVAPVAVIYATVPFMPAACLSALLSGLVCWPFGEPLAVSGYELFLLALFGLVTRRSALHCSRSAQGFCP